MKPPWTSRWATCRQDLQVRWRLMAREQSTLAEMTIPGRRTRREMEVACARELSALASRPRRKGEAIRPGHGTREDDCRYEVGAGSRGRPSRGGGGREPRGRRRSGRG